MRPFVVYWNNIPSPYMVERFNALTERDAFEFEAWFNDRTHSDRSWNVDEASWRFRYRYMPVTRLAGWNIHWPLPLLGQRRPDVLVSLYAEPSFLAGWSLAKLRGVKTGFWIEVTFDHLVRRTFFKESLKKWIFPKVDAIITVGTDGERFAKRYGTSERNIWFAPHTIDVAHFEEVAAAERPQREHMRAKLGLEGTVFVYVGRLWWAKGVNYLLEAFAAVQRRSAEPVSLLLVGDGPDEAKLKCACAERGIRNVVFTGFQQKPDLPRYYALADVFVFPTLGDTYGLVIDEAMACSLPVISTSAVGEIRDRVKEGVNGFIVPPEDSVAMAERMLFLARDPMLRSRMGDASSKKIQGQTPDKWAADFEQIVRRLLSNGHT